MQFHKIWMGGLLAALWMPFVWAAPDINDAELARIRAEIQQMRETYEARIAALEKRLAQAENKTESKVDSRAAPAEPVAASAAATPAAAAQNAFNPAVSLILSGTYASLQRDPDTYEISGFIPSGGEVGPPKRSFSLAESELVLSANIDPNWYGQFALAHDPDNEVAVEEAFVQSLGLPHGVTFKAGRFYSGIGYINEQHRHVWDFVDAPLAQSAFLGGNLGNDGVQLKWLAPTDTYLEFGAEAGRGQNFPGSERNKNGVGDWSLFAHAGGDVGDSHSWRAGLSYLHNQPQNREFEAEDVTNSFSGTSKLWIADAVWKWVPNGNARERNFKLQGEYYRRSENGDLSYDTSAPAVYAYRSTQSGWYAQGVYQFMPRWRAGLRFDKLYAGSVDADPALYASLPLLAPYDPSRGTLMLDYSPSEFSRLRLQFARDKARRDEADNQIMLQYVMSLGSHGAHAF
jgi:hypothetical protein